jgi:hypothetical protein
MSINSLKKNLSSEDMNIRFNAVRMLSREFHVDDCDEIRALLAKETDVEIVTFLLSNVSSANTGAKDLQLWTQFRDAAVRVRQETDIGWEYLYGALVESALRLFAGLTTIEIFQTKRENKLALLKATPAGKDLDSLQKLYS